MDSEAVEGERAVQTSGSEAGEGQAFQTPGGEAGEGQALQASGGEAACLRFRNNCQYAPFGVLAIIGFERTRCRKQVPIVADNQANQAAENQASQPVDKQALRAQARAVREELGVEGRAKIDAAIAERVCSNEHYLQADAVFTYLSVGAEVDTRAIMRDAWSRGKLVAVPRCVPGTNLMDWYRIDDFDGLERSSFGIDEPAADPSRLVEVPGPGARSLDAAAVVGVAAADAVAGAAATDTAADTSDAAASATSTAAIAIVPGYSFDAEGYRLGYGGGFYDVFLPTFDGFSIGLCRSVQFSDVALPRFETDVAVDLVITDSSVI